MKKLKDAIARDLWVILLDLIAVNLSYYLAFYFRFYVNMKLGLENADKYLEAFLGFAPYYSILAIIIFFAWKLYGGLWRYAGINDMNRIIMANICTLVIHVAGTAAFFIRMPVTYYIGGAILQFFFIVVNRFGYRILLVEKKKLRSRGLAKTNTIVVGRGENGRRVLKSLEESEAFRPVLVIGPETGTMDGIPITTMDRADWKDIGAVFIADPLLSSAKREKIRSLAEKAGAEIHDYTGYFSNLGGKLSLTELLAVIHTPVTVSLDGKETVYKDGQNALGALTEKYEIQRIDAENMKITIGPQHKMSTQEVLAQAYAAVMEDNQS